MPEVRIDPLTGLRAIVGSDAPSAQDLAVSAPAALERDRDPFAEGQEARTPPELSALRPAGGPADGPGWSVRVLPSPDPALIDEPPAVEPEANRDLFWAGPAQGAHELIVNAPATVRSLSELGADDVAGAVEVWRERMRAHRGAAYVHLTVDEGVEARAESVHSHAQLYALEFVPAAVARERERFGAYATRTMGGNLLADLVQEEVRRRERVVAIDDECVLMSPFGARVAFQLLIAPRRPRMRFEDEGPSGANMLHQALGRLQRRFGSSPPLSLWVRTAPRGAEHFSWRIDILPRLTRIGGLELGAGVHLNPVAPERAAAELRDV
jgi:UDPglucose--hexose-1-phosphate uridylyltransferase